jgi:dipeptidyl aminopeptidase/acylaminoacyl peptidase
MLVAARANHINMFGDLQQASGSFPAPRSAVSLTQHTFTEVGADFDPDPDPAGTRMVFASTRHSFLPDLYIKNVGGVAVTQLTSDPASDIQPAVSPDGTQVAFTSNRSGNWDIWLISIDGGSPIQVTRDRADDVHPTWSPDGRKLAFSSLPVSGGQWALWIVDVKTGSTRQFIGYGLFPEWSPVGDTILFQRARERGSRWFSVWTLTLVGGEPRYPTEVASSATGAVILPSWSPDGTRIAYVSTATLPPVPVSTALGGTTEVFDIWVMNADGREKIRLTDGHTANFAPAFSPDGRIFFTSSRSGHETIWSLFPGVHPVGPSVEDRTVTDATQSNTQVGVQTASGMNKL